MEQAFTRTFAYPVSLGKDRESGGYVARFRDLPEAVTQGESIEDALANASDCAEEAIAGRIRRGDLIPKASRARRGERLVAVPAAIAAKAALWLAVREAGVTNAELARRLRCDEKEVRRMLDPRHPTKLPRIQAALAALGRRLVLSLEDAA